MAGHRQDDRQGGNTHDLDAATRQEGQQTDLDRGHGVKGQGGQEASRGVPDPEGAQGDAAVEPAGAPPPGPRGGLAEEFGDLDDDGLEGDGLPGHLGGGMIGG